MIKSSLQVLLVEDNPDHAVLVRSAILKSRTQKYEVDSCISVEEAIEKLKTNPYNMIISDFHLPGKNGLDLLDWLNSEKIDIPFIMLTGSGDEKTAVKAIQNGAYNYLIKDDPALFDVIPHAVDEAFLRYLAEQQKERYEREIREKNVALEKANRELKKLDQLKSDFISSVSHDIRTPLNSVQESIALLLDGIVDQKTEKGTKVLEIAQRNVKRLTDMINDLLDFSKLEAGKMKLHIGSSDIQILVDEVIGNLKVLADKKSISFKFDLIENFPKIDCDAERLLQVMTNLVGNAIKFTPDKGTISISLEKAGTDRIKMIVADTGVGIAKENLDRVFERFEQVREKTIKTSPGTGLGLSICKELVRLHHGEIWAESELGHGSRFIIQMPIHYSVREEEKN